MIHEGLGGANNVALAVFDGHGQEGEKVSRYLASTLPGMLAKSAAFKVTRRQPMPPRFCMTQPGLPSQESLRCSRQMAVSHALMQAAKYRQCCEEQFPACNAALRKIKAINSMLSGSTGCLALLQVGPCSGLTHADLHN